jgi:tetratricopeptide (TPR) repeat protein
MSSGHLTAASLVFTLLIIFLTVFWRSSVRRFGLVVGFSLLLIGSVTVFPIWLTLVGAESPPAPNRVQADHEQAVSEKAQSDAGPAALGKPPDIRDILLQASTAADEIDNNRLDKAAASIRIAEVYRDLGNGTEARATLARALLNARVMQETKYTNEAGETRRGSNFRVGVLTGIAQAQGRLGDVDNAKATLREALQFHVQSPREDQLGRLGGIEELVAIAVTLAELGDLQGAVSTAEAIDHVDRRPAALEEIAVLQARSGHLASAYQIAEMETGQGKTRITLGIAVQQVQAGQIEAAYETAKAIEREPSYIAFLTEVATAHAKSGDRTAGARVIEAALEATGRIEPNSKPGAEYGEWAHDSFALPRIAGAQTRLGNLAGAKKTAALIREPANKPFPLESIAHVQVDMGDFSGALETISGFDDQEYFGAKDGVRIAIGRAQLRAGNISGALETAESIRNDASKGGLSKSIAIAQAASGDWATATTMFDQGPADRGYPIPSRLSDIARALSSRGEVRTAYQWATNQKTPEARAFALIGVAQGMLAKQ